MGSQQSQLATMFSQVQFGLATALSIGTAAAPSGPGGALGLPGPGGRASLGGPGMGGPWGPQQSTAPPPKVCWGLGLSGL